MTKISVKNIKGETVKDINLDSKIGEELLSGSIDSLIDKCFAQHASYYNKVEQMVLDRWYVLLG